MITTLARAVLSEGEPQGWGEHIPAWCKRTGNKLIEAREEGGKIFRYWIRKR